MLSTDESHAQTACDVRSHDVFRTYFKPEVEAIARICFSFPETELESLRLSAAVQSRLEFVRLRQQVSFD